MQDKLLLLKQATLFHELADAELMPIAQASHLQHYAAHTLLFTAGEPATHCYLLIHGLVRLYRLTPDGKEKVIELIRAGDTFAEAVVFLKKPYPVYAQALETIDVLAIPSQILLQEIQSKPALSLKLLANLSRRLHQFLNDIHALSLENAQQRVAGFLLAMPEQELATLSIPKATIASRLGLTPETFSRVLGKLKEQGVISETNGGLYVLDVQGLRQVLNGTH
ncbi:cAMP-binding protein [Beggiatoa alba B18LD]|uniref:cAMP-binding protein n=1 Tax=Beggiatoa alba B18LD TaxID=395493 RepID=I3CH39_9GAMM|nr:Crp/Fnr family transcriptional regulator [Beggiatoa alba]EIJ42932.1 cAMP-binding protein [Beggiatoa alba B18LD]